MEGDATVEEVEWIAASDALDILTRGGENPVNVQAMLAEYLRAGSLRARAEAVWTTSENALGAAWKSDASSETVEREIEVPLRYWRSDKRALVDRARWRWPFNKFFYTVTVKPLKRRMFKGVRFNSGDLAKLQPGYFISSKKAPRGRKHDPSGRDRGWLALVAISQEGQLHSDQYKLQGDLEAEIQERLRRPNGKLALGQGQIREIASQVMNVLEPRPADISE